MADQSATTLCTAALRKLRVIDPVETPNTTELANTFSEMVRMLKQWAAKRIFVPYSTEDTHTLTAGTASYTIGSGGTINTARPIQINDGSFVLANGLPYPLKVIGEREYLGLPYKDIGTDYPSRIWYKPEYPIGKVFLWPPGGGELHLWSTKHFTTPATIGNDWTFPEESQDAIVWNLACRMGPEFGVEPSPFIFSMARDSLTTIINLNAANDVSELNNELAVLNSEHGQTFYDIDGG
jgi:hypothetical protein